MGYCITTDVAALCTALTAGCPDFAGNTQPTQDEVTGFISTGSAFINTLLKGNGYTIPGSTNDVFHTLTQANAFYAAALAERARTTTIVGPGESTRADMMWKDFDRMMGYLGIEVGSLDLSSAGLGAVNEAGPYAGGISKADVESVESDDDRVVPRFVRGQFRSGDASRPRGKSYTG